MAGPQVVGQSSSAYGCGEVTTSPRDGRMPSHQQLSTICLLHRGSVQTSWDIFSPRGRDRGQRQQCPALSAEEVVSQGKKKKKKNGNSKNFETKIAENILSCSPAQAAPLEQTLVTSGIPSLSRNLKEGKISGPGWAGDARVVFNGNYLPMRSLGTRAGLQGAQFPALWGL